MSIQKYYSNRNKDVKETEYLNMLLDDYYTSLGINFQRIHNVEEQVKGIDVKFYKDNQIFLVDEKAAIKYMTKPLNTFAFELSSVNNQYEHGWFTSPIMLTTHYALIYPHSQQNDIYHLDDFEYIFISKKKLKDYISQFIDLDKDVEQFKLDNLKSKDDCFQRIAPGIKLRWSKHIVPEQPINIIINKEILQKLAIFDYIKKFN